MKNLVVSTTHWLIDSDGTSYGDERERLKYYEAHSAWINMQALLTPSLAAVLILVSPRSALVPVLVLSYFPTLLSFFPLVYLRSEEVNLIRNATKNRKYQLVYMTSMLPLFATLYYKFETSKSKFAVASQGNKTSFLIGMALGIGSVFAFFLARYLKEKKRN